MARGLDYAYSHPNLPCITQAGYAFVARYVGDPDPNPDKYLDAAEVKALRTLGLSIVACRETTAGFMLTDSGDTHARIARSHCNALGLRDVPIYYALDVDPRNLSGTQVNAVTEFLQDAARVDGGGHLVGLYGAAAAIDRWVGTPYCHWGWQTYAWSGGKISPKAHFRQYRNGQTVCGGTVDLNETYADDFGQWPRPGGSPPPQPTKEIDKMYVGIAHPDPNMAWWSDFATRRAVTVEEMGILAFVIRMAGGTVLLTEDNKPQSWSQGMIDSIPVISRPTQLLDFVADPDGGGAWLVMMSSLRWQIGNDAQALADHQNHWAARGYNTAVQTWDREDLLTIPVVTTSASVPVPWPATGTVHGEITFTQ